MCGTLDLHFLNDTANISPLNHVGKDIKKDGNFSLALLSSANSSSQTTYIQRNHKREVFRVNRLSGR